MSSNRRFEIIALAVILLLAVYLRAGHAGITEFKADEANLSLLALDFAAGGDVPLLGIGSSVGFPNAPVNVYLLAIPYAFDSSPLLATQFIGLMNVVAVGLVYIIARPYVGPLPALLAALLYAVNPWGVIFSRKIWAQNMLPPFVLLVLWTGLTGFVQGKRWAQWLHVPLLVITGQIHYGAFVIVPASLALVASGRQRLTRAFWLSLVMAAILALPFLVGLSQAGLLSLDALQDSLAVASVTDESGGSGDEALLSSEALRGALVIVAGTEPHALTGPEQFRAFLDRVPDAYLVFNPLALLVLSAAVWLIIRSVRWHDTRTPVDVALLLLVVFPVLAFSFTWTPFFIHYLIPMLPAAFLVLAFAVHDWWWLLVSRRRVRQLLIAGAGGWLLVVVTLQVWLSVALLDFVDSNPTPGAFGTPLHYLLDVREAILRDSPAQVIGNLHGASVNFAGEDRVWRALLHDVPVVRFESEQVTVYPREPAVLLVAGCDPAETGVVYTLRAGEGCYQVSQRSDGPEAGYLPFESATWFANGIHGSGYRVSRSDESVCVNLLWEITTLPQDEYLFAVHFFDDEAIRIAQADGLSWAAENWQIGDRVDSQFCAAVPADRVAYVDIGMYTLHDGVIQGVNLVDEMGAAIGQMFRLVVSG